MNFLGKNIRDLFEKCKVFIKKMINDYEHNGGFKDFLSEGYGTYIHSNGDIYTGNSKIIKNQDKVCLDIFWR